MNRQTGIEGSDDSVLKRTQLVNILSFEGHAALFQQFGSAIAAPK